MRLEAFLYSCLGRCKLQTMISMALVLTGVAFVVLLHVGGVDEPPFAQTPTSMTATNTQENSQMAKIGSSSVSIRFLETVRRLYLKTDANISQNNGQPMDFEAANNGNQQDNSIALPYVYPMHLSLPKDKTGMASAILSTFFEKPATNDKTAVLDRRNSNPQQCLSHSQNSPVISLDRNALRKDVLVRSTKDGNTQPPNVNGSDLSERLGKEFGFDHRRLYARRSPSSQSFSETSPEKKLVQVDNLLDVASNPFYSGAASDCILPQHSDKKVREKWGQRKVDWVSNSDGRRIVDWGSYDDEGEDGNLPCTQYVQHRLHSLMNPQICAASNEQPQPLDANHNSEDQLDQSLDPFEAMYPPSLLPKYLVGSLRSPNEGFGTGAAISLVAYDMLSAIVLKRVLLLSGKSKKWHFASSVCAEAGHPSWDCFWQFPSHCQYSVADSLKTHPHKIKSKKEALKYHDSHAIMKENFDASGLGRNDVPSDEEFFGPKFVGRNPKCFQRYKDWTEDPSHTYIQGTFSKGSDPRLFYMMAQAMRYLLRYQQPWFYNMLAQGLGVVGMEQGVPTPDHFRLEENDVFEKVAKEGKSHPDNEGIATIYLHERGEINKFREYYSNFGCHNVRSELLIDLSKMYCQKGLWGDVTTKEKSDEGMKRSGCHVFISGNTPSGNYKYLRDELLKESSNNNDANLKLSSTWTLFDSSTTSETARWGANSPSAGWIDLYSGTASSHWACIVQSNWCRLVNWLRLTNGRSTCGGFVDLGALMVSSPVLREAYCIVNMSWPTKAFSNRLK